MKTYPSDSIHIKQQQLDPSYTFDHDVDSTETLDTQTDLHHLGYDSSNNEDEGKQRIFDQQDSVSQLQADGAEGQADRRLSVSKRCGVGAVGRHACSLYETGEAMAKPRNWNWISAHVAKMDQIGKRGGRAEFPRMLSLGKFQKQQRRSYRL